MEWSNVARAWVYVVTQYVHIWKYTDIDNHCQANDLKLSKVCNSTKSIKKSFCLGKTNCTVHVGNGIATSHSVESPSMVDPKWNTWQWGSKWNLHTVCWGAVGCKWGTTSVYFGITYVCFIPSRLPVFAVEPQYRHQHCFIFVKSIIWGTHTKSLKKFMLVWNLNGVCRTNIE